MLTPGIRRARRRGEPECERAPAVEPTPPHRRSGEATRSMLRQPSPSRSPVAAARRRPRREGSEPWARSVMRDLRRGVAWSTKAPNEVTFDGAGPRRSVSKRGSEEPHRALPPKTRRRSDGPPRQTHIRRTATPACTSDRSLPRPEISTSAGHVREAETSRDRWTTLRRPYARDRSSPLTDGGPDGRAGEPTRTTSDAAPRPLPQLVATGRGPKLILRQSPLEHADPTPKRRGDEASDPYTTEVCARNETLS
jgi:hypothetical protein